MKNKQGGSMLHLELTVVKTMLRIRDGPLENLWGGRRAKYKKNIRARQN